MSDNNNAVALLRGDVFAYHIQHMFGTRSGLYCGFFALMGGMGQMYLNIQVPKGLISKIGEAAITAGVSTFMGLIVKSIWLVAKRALVDYIRSYKKPKKSKL